MGDRENVSLRIMGLNKEVGTTAKLQRTLQTSSKGAKPLWKQMM